MDPIKKLAFYVNAKKMGAIDLAQRLAAKAETLGITTKTLTEEKIEDGFLKDQDACCVIGGDGTILSTVKECVKYQVPVFGINQGKLGFLATFSVKDAERDFEKILSGKFQIKRRFVIRCTTQNGRESIALNDVVIKHMEPSRMMELEVFANNEYVTSYSCDGLIISTPTGSTAYNLSAGGPIIYPGATVFAMTPICPHTLSNRAVIFDKDNVMTVTKPDTEGDDHPVQVSLDGRVPDGWSYEGTFPISVNIAEATLPLLQPIGYSHFRILRNKLNWGD